MTLIQSMMIRGLLLSMMDALVEQITGVMYNFLSPGCTYLAAYIRTGGIRKRLGGSNELLKPV